MITRYVFRLSRWNNALRRYVALYEVVGADVAHCIRLVQFEVSDHRARYPDATFRFTRKPYEV